MAQDACGSNPNLGANPLLCRYHACSAIDAFRTEMPGQQVIDHGAMLVAIRAAIAYQHRLDGLHQGGAVGEAQLADQEVRLDGFQLFRVG